MHFPFPIHLLCPDRGCYVKFSGATVVQSYHVFLRVVLGVGFNAIDLSINGRLRSFVSRSLVFLLQGTSDMNTAHWIELYHPKTRRKGCPDRSGVYRQYSFSVGWYPCWHLLCMTGRKVPPNWILTEIEHDFVGSVWAAYTAGTLHFGLGEFFFFCRGKSGFWA